MRMKSFIDSKVYLFIVFILAFGLFVFILVPAFELGVAHAPGLNVTPTPEAPEEPATEEPTVVVPALSIVKGTPADLLPGENSPPEGSDDPAETPIPQPKAPTRPAPPTLPNPNDRPSPTEPGPTDDDSDLKLSMSWSQGAACDEGLVSIYVQNLNEDRSAENVQIYLSVFSGDAFIAGEIDEGFVIPRIAAGESAMVSTTIQFSEAWLNGDGSEQIDLQALASKSNWQSTQAFPVSASLSIQNTGCLASGGNDRDSQLVVTISGEPTSSVCYFFTFTVTIENTGDEDSTDVELQIDFPPNNWRYVDSVTEYGFFRLGTIPAGESVEVPVEVGMEDMWRELTAYTEITVEAYIYNDSSNPGNEGVSDSFTLSTDGTCNNDFPRLEVDIYGLPDSAVCEELWLTLAVYNDGEETATDVELELFFPEGDLYVDSITDDGYYYLGDIPAGEYAEVYVDVYFSDAWRMLTEYTDLYLGAYIRNEDTTPEYNEFIKEETSVWTNGDCITFDAELDIEIVGNENVCTPASFDVTVTNLGEFFDARDVVLEFDFDWSENGYYWVEQPYPQEVYDLGDLCPGCSETVTLTFGMQQAWLEQSAGTELEIRVEAEHQIDGGEGGSEGTSEMIILTNPGNCLAFPELSLDIYGVPDGPVCDDVDLTIVVYNETEDTAINVILEFEILSGSEFVDSVSEDYWELGDIPGGDSVEVNTTIDMNDLWFTSLLYQEVSFRAVITNEDANPDYNIGLDYEDYVYTDGECLDNDADLSLSIDGSLTVCSEPVFEITIENTGTYFTAEGVEVNITFNEGADAYLSWLPEGTQWDLGDLCPGCDDQFSFAFGLNDAWRHAPAGTTLSFEVEASLQLEGSAVFYDETITLTQPGGCVPDLTLTVDGEESFCENGDFDITVSNGGAPAHNITVDVIFDPQSEGTYISWKQAEDSWTVSTLGNGASAEFSYAFQMSEDWLLANAGTQMGFDVLLTYDEGEDLGETVTLTHPGGCVDPTATPTNTPTATPTNTPTATPTPTATSVPIEEEKEIPTATAPVIPHSVSPMRFPETCSDWLLYHRVSPDGMALYRLEGVEGQESASLVTLTDAGAEIETSPSRSWDQQWIAYQSNAAGNWDILLMDSFGADHVVLVDDAGDDVNPMFSPDNRTIVFQSNRNGNWDLFTVDRLTGKTRQITDTEGNDINPYFSPNPDWLVYQSDAAGSWDIYVLYLPTGYQFRITDTETAERLPAWSPNGQHLAYLQKSEAGLWQLVISRIDGSQARVISVDQPASLAWSPDGWRLAYQAEVEGNLDIFYYDLNSDQEIRLTEYEGLDMAPSWNCDGSKIAFNSARSGENENIFSIDLGSLTLTQLTNHEEDDQWPLWFMAKEFASQAVLSGHSMHYITGKMAKIKP